MQPYTKFVEYGFEVLGLPFFISAGGSTWVQLGAPDTGDYGPWVLKKKDGGWEFESSESYSDMCDLFHRNTVNAVISYLTANDSPYCYLEM